MSDTNDIARALRVAEEDLASYYLLEYAPGNELWDGRFRRIEVKVRRPGVSVQARQGYFAVRTPLPTPLLDYESPEGEAIPAGLHRARARARAPGRGALRASIELRQGDTPVFSAPADFAQAVGRATLLGGVPLDGITPGHYELRVTVADGVDRTVRWAQVTIAP